MFMSLVEEPIESSVLSLETDEKAPPSPSRESLTSLTSSSYHPGFVASAYPLNYERRLASSKL